MTAINQDIAMKSLFTTFLLATLTLCFVGARTAEPKKLTVLAAISLRDVLQDVTPAFEKANDVKVEFVFGASGQLAAQAKAGPAGDLFISAAAKQVDELVAANVADGDSRTVVAGNTLVLVAPAGAKESITRFDDLGGVKRLAIGEPKSVPAGTYAMQTLAHLKLDTELKERLVYGANVRQVADYVARGEVEAGMVYATDAMAMDGVKVVAVAEVGWHEPIQYPAVVLKAAKEPTLAKQFVAMLRSDAGRAALAQRGFAPAPPTTQPAGHE